MAKRKTRKKLKKPQAVHLITQVSNNAKVKKDYQKIGKELQRVCKKKRKKQIMVTSSLAGEGKSTSIANLAITLAQAGKKVLLVDADMRRPTVYKSFALSNHIGLSELLSGKEATVDACIQTSEIPNLDLLPSGEKTKKSGKLLRSKRMVQLIKELKKKDYDFILYDMPPVGMVKDGLYVAKRLDGVLLVIREEKIKKKMLKEVIRDLEENDGEIIGTIFNEYVESF